MLTHDAQQAAPADAMAGQAAAPDGAHQAEETRVRIAQVTPAGAATLAGAALGALGLVWVLYERVLPFSGVLGFWLSWYVVFLILYNVMARLQWDRLDARNRL